MFCLKYFRFFGRFFPLETNLECAIWDTEIPHYQAKGKRNFRFISISLFFRCLYDIFRRDLVYILFMHFDAFK